MCSVPGSRISSVNVVWPVRSAGSSLRGTLFPMYCRAVSVMPASFVAPFFRERLSNAGHLLQLHDVLARVHGLLVPDEELRDGAVVFGLHLVEGLHHLDQAHGVPGRDAVALVDVEITLRVGTAVEGARHLRLYGLVGQFSLL